MTTDEALLFLQAHQPLPPTKEISNELLSQFDEVRKHFAAHPDSRCVPLLLNSFGQGDGHGVYQRVEDTLRVHSPEIVVEALLQGLRSPHHSIRQWNAEIAANYPRPELVKPLAELLRHGTIDEQMSAAIALKLNDNPEARRELNDALNSNMEEEVKRAILELFD